jgi:hypothetical protein
MRHGARKLYQTDREGISYHYHEKMRVVSAIPWRKVFKKKNPGVIVACAIHVAVSQLDLLE